MQSARYDNKNVKRKRFTFDDEWNKNNSCSKIRKVTVKKNNNCKQSHSPPIKPQRQTYWSR